MISELWDLRVDKVVADLKEGRRIDARKVDEVRKITVTHGVSENADGSARVRLGETDVIAGIKMVPGEPYPDMPDEGSISVGAELLPMADPEFEVGPPRAEAIELSRVVDRGIRESKAIDFKDLCIKEGEQVWIGFVDIYILNNDGNLFDACGVAAISALLETKLPKLDGGKIVKGEYAGKLKIKAKPILNTFAKVGNVVVADPVLSEEKSMSARFSVAVTEDDKITAFQKGLAGSFKYEEINACIDIAMRNSKQIRKLL
ncbi:MAG: exosome complex protein Rrp42 [Candidatus Diapherotrites archaeon]|uniref:Exosome complex protein Rrp42 n=1 Tax=Candidatus Iainarchaeum sp. TaxID=3101447 RepID=A0A8T3YLW6_9ARCH|nr:exosome complex protein Rrp42 [Candidatus Diapherotrites archaeon]